MFEFIEAKRLAEEHWAWLASVLDDCSISNVRQLIKFLYISAFIHGYKHAQRTRDSKGRYISNDNQ